jgi:hypothetical protein
VELRVHMCAGKQDILGSTEEWSFVEHLWVGTWKSFFPWLVASLFMDLERALLLTGYKPMCVFWDS